jgi:Fuc2NAc and GlcNAc transferase
VTALLTTLVLSALLCGLYQRYAVARQILDIPNQRSSHSMPTPYGGGVPLLLAFTFGLALAAWLHVAWDGAFVVLTIGALVLMLIGVVDDVRGLSVRWRLLIYSAVCLLTTTALLQDMITTMASDILRAALVLFWALVLLWSLNLYNFMDGIDGIAALQTVFICCAAAFLSWSAGHNGNYVLYCLLLAAAHCGFLFWNYPPARLFMGDAGSVPTGFLLASLALLGMVQGQVSPLCWLVLSAVFITDASWVLIWRVITRQDFTQPHRMHAYQRLSRHWNSHKRVDLLLMGINVLWLFPIALAVQSWPQIGLFLVFFAYLPLLYGMAKTTRLA